MIRPTAPFNANSLVAADVLKLLKALQAPAVTPPRPNAAGQATLISAGPLGAIKDPTGGAAMSIVQLGQSQSGAETLASNENGETGNDMRVRAYVQSVEQEYVANNSVSSEELDASEHSSHEAALVSANATAEKTPVPISAQTIPQTPVLGEPLVFIPPAPYMQPTARKNRSRSAKQRSSWKFIFGKSDDLER